jgi:hypothetical protein
VQHAPSAARVQHRGAGLVDLPVAVVVQPVSAEVGGVGDVRVRVVAVPVALGQAVRVVVHLVAVDVPVAVVVQDAVADVLGPGIGGRVGVVAVGVLVEAVAVGVDGDRVVITGAVVVGGVVVGGVVIGHVVVGGVVIGHVVSGGVVVVSRTPPQREHEAEQDCQIGGFGHGSLPHAQRIPPRAGVDGQIARAHPISASQDTRSSPAPRVTIRETRLRVVGTSNRV